VSQKSITEKIKEAGKHGLIYGFGSIAQSAAGFLLLPLYANNLTPNEYGIFSLIQMIGTIFGAIFYMGASSALPRSYFEYDDAGDRRKVFNSTLLILVTGAILQIVIGLLYSNYISKVTIGSSEYGNLVFINLISSAILFINTGFFVYLRLIRESRIVVLTSVVNILITISCAYYLLVITQLGIGAPIYAILLSQSITLTFFIIYLQKPISTFRLLPKEISIQFKYGFPIAAASLAQMVFEWSDRLIMNNLLTTSDVGVYSMGIKVANIYMVLIAFSFVMIWSPMMMEYKNDKNLKVLFSKITFYYTLISLIFIAISKLFFLEVFNYLMPVNQFKTGIILVPYIMFGLFSYSLVNIFNAGILYEKKTNILLNIYIVWGLISVVMNYVLITKYHIYGAVFSGIIIKVGIAGSVLFYSRKYFTYPIYQFRYGQVVFGFIAILLLEEIIIKYFGAQNLIFIKVGFFSFILYFTYSFILNSKEVIFIKNIIKQLNKK